VGDGSDADGRRWRDALLKGVDEWNLQNRVPGKGVPLPGAAIRILKAMVFLIDFKTGRLDPALETIAKYAGCSKSSVVRNLKSIEATGILDWVRRSIKTGNAKGEGPQRQQTSNAYFFDPTRMPKRLAMRIRELVSRSRLWARNDGLKTRAAADRADVATQFREAAPGSPKHQLQASLDSLGRSLGFT
jgi:hypothetical protein